MMYSKGSVDLIAGSGKIWVGSVASDIQSMVFESLESAKTSIQISSFSLGEKNDEVKQFFDIVEDKLEAGRTVQFIVNDAEGNLVRRYSRMRLNKLLTYDNFDLQNFKSKKGRNALHAKVIIVDRKIALVGSANISQHGLFSNYEIMLKVSGKAVADIAGMLDKLAMGIKRGDPI